MSKIRALLLSLSLAVAVLVAVAVGAVQGDDATTPRLELATTTTADPTDGHAYVTEAIENLRVAGAFTFTQVTDGPTSARDPRAGKVEGAVELAQGPEDEPRYHSKLDLKTPTGAVVALEAIAIGEDVHVKGPKQESFTRSAQKAKKAKGKGAGKKGVEVAVVDPVLQLLEPVDTLPAGAFGTPSALDDEGDRSVQIQLPQSASLSVVIDDATRQIVRMTFSNSGSTASYALRDVGSDAVTVPEPS